MKLFWTGHHRIEFFFLPAVPTEHLEGHRKPHFPMSPNSVQIPIIMWKYIPLAKQWYNYRIVEIEVWVYWKYSGHTYTKHITKDKKKKWISIHYILADVPTVFLRYPSINLYWIFFQNRSEKKSKSKTLDLSPCK